MAQECCEGEGVEDLVKPEVAGHGVGPFQPVHDGPNRVEQAADQDLRHHHGIGGEEIDHEYQSRIPEHDV